MNSKRFAQIKELQTKYGREYIETSIIDLNVEITRWNTVLVEALEQYIREYINSEDFSLDTIQWILTKLSLYKWFQFPTNISLNKMLFNLIFNLVLLPDYIKDGNKEKNYKEIKEIISDYITSFDQNINLIHGDEYCLEIGNAYDLFKEAERNTEEWSPLLDTRIFHVWEWFGANVFMYHEKMKNFVFQISLDLESKKNKTKRLLKQEKIQELIMKAITQYKWVESNQKFQIYMQLIKDDTSLYSDDWENTGKYLALCITKENQLVYRQDIIHFLNDLLKLNNYLINTIAKEYKLAIGKRIHLFSNGESLVVSKIWWETQTSIHNLLVTEKQKVSLEDIWWQTEAKKEIKEIIAYIKYEDVFVSWGSKQTNGIIFEWPPWTGKTMLAKAIAYETNALFYNIKLTDIQKTAYINEWANNIKKIFDEIRKKSQSSNKKIIVLLDELEALFWKRTANTSSEDTKVVNTFLTEMGWYETLENVIFIGTTNMFDALDEAVIRSGRMTKKITVWLPNQKDREETYEIYLKKLPQKAIDAFKNIDKSELARLSDRISQADIAEVIRSITFKKAIEEIDTKEAKDITIEELKEIIWKVKKISKARSIWFMTN